MIIAAWILLGALCCCAQAMAPPAVAALEPETRESDHDESLAVPDKRILKYLLPSTQAWGGNAVNEPIPTGQEGTKRGYVDRNFLRFGRSEADKRDAGRNFLRFGRAGSEDYEDDDETSVPSADKRNRNFLRFGRDPSRNFLRFGRSGLEEEYGIERSPVAFAQDLEEEPSELEKRAHKNYLRFGRGNKNFLRFGRNYNKNFLRFGRSVDAQTFCEDCEEENLNKHSTATSSSSSSSSSPSTTFSSGHDEGSNKNLQESDEPTANEARDLSATGDRVIHRSKRSAPAYYDYAVVPAHSPVSWARDFQPAEDEEVEDPDLEDALQDVNKRTAYNRNFLRFGRDRNFLRFGKRDSSSSDGSNMMVMTPVQYPRIIRASNRNFLRFG